MSKQPSCVIEEIIEVDPKEFDGQLGTMLSKCEGDTNKFLTIVFGYLQRKTNFYKDGEAQRKVLEAVAQVEPSIKLKSGSRPAATEATTPKPAAAAPTPSPPAPAPKPEPAPTPASAPAAQPSTSAPAKEDQIQTIDDAEEKPKGLKPNHGRGYDYPHYSWTQTLSEVSVSVPVPSGTKAKMLDVVMAKNKIKVGVKGQPAIIEGELSEAIKPDDCIWNIEGGVVELTLTKHDGMHWWSSVLKGDEPIDVHQVEPENSKLGDLDAETRQTVEKMMFDQRQKALGLPSSDEIKKQEMLKKFMEAHPEMDFSKAKMM